MARRMLIDATHPEETRVVVLNGNKLEEFDFETSTKKQIKGNIYLARVTRVEPSLQAAFVEYGGNRHGFLAFSEIHPDYYRIPVSDREAMIAAEEAANAASSFDEDDIAPAPDAQEEPPEEPHPEEAASVSDEPPDALPAGPVGTPSETSVDVSDSLATGEGTETAVAYAPVALHENTSDEHISDEHGFSSEEPTTEIEPAGETAEADDDMHDVGEAPVPLETVGGDAFEEVNTRPRVRHYRNYKIQEVIKRHQILLIQVNKEERGTKGAALTTYLSLAGRYCVLMPNAGRGGGVSRKITSAIDRRRLKDLMEELEVPEGMGVIVRTAGSERSQAEIKRDYEYLMRLWDDIRDLTLRSSAPALIYEEGNLIKRAIRDLYSRDIEEIQVEGEEGYRTAKEFMRMLMPSHSSRVRPYRDPSIPLFHRFQVDAQIDEIHNPVVQLRSGGYIVINPTEALVSIDVNSGRSTRERNIEETATKTNAEAAEEIARQLRLRDLAGLVVIDFIDMEDIRNQKSVEARLKDAMKSDRARIQLGRISPFGLLELSRQRLRSSLIEASTQICPHCNGTGTIRSTESTTLVVLRALEEEGIRRRTSELTVYVPTHIALYLLNQKRETLIAIEARYGFRVTVAQDDSLIPPAYRLDRLAAFTPAQLAALPVLHAPVWEDEDDDIVHDEASPIVAVAAPAEAVGDGEPPAQPGDEDRPKRRRRRRKRRRIGGDGSETATDGSSQEFAAGDDGDDEEDDDAPGEAESADDDQGQTELLDDAGVSTEAPPPEQGEEGADRRRRRRGRRGGQRRRREDEVVPPVVEAIDDLLPYQSPFDFARDGRVDLFADTGEETQPEPLPTGSAEEPAPVLETGIETASLLIESDGPSEESAPKRRRPSRRKPRASEDEAEAIAMEAASEQDEAKPPRRSRSRKKPEAAETGVDVPLPLIQPEPAAPVDAVEETAPPDIAAEHAPADPESDAPPDTDDGAEDDNRPRRSGWWKRLIS